MIKGKYILLSTPLVLLLMGGLYKIVDYQTHSHCQIYIPDLRGMSFTDASQIAQDRGLKLIVVDSVLTSEGLNGMVLSQMPKAQSLLSKDDKIEITVQYIRQ